MALADQLGLGATGAAALPASGTVGVTPQINPLLAKLLQGYQNFLGSQRAAAAAAPASPGAAVGGAATTGGGLGAALGAAAPVRAAAPDPNVDPLIAQGGKAVAYDGPGQQPAAAGNAASGLPVGAGVNAVAGNKRAGKPFMNIEFGGRQFHVYYGDEFKGGRKVVEITKPKPVTAAPAAAADTGGAAAGY